MNAFQDCHFYTGFLLSDPSGNHCIVSMTSTEVFYIAKSAKKPRLLSKLKGHLIDSVGWNVDVSEFN